MPRKSDSLSHSFACPKCRGRKPHIREISLAKAGLPGFLPGKDNRYIEVTCILCGYTEFYNRAIYMASLEPAADTAHMPLPERAKGG